MSIGIASDHGGFNLKGIICKYLKEQGIDYIDYGVNSPESVDYPDQAILVAEAVAAGTHELGILVCGTGQGIGISANKVPGIRCGVCADTFSARMIREHNNANVLSLGERVVGPGLALEIVATFLGAKFQGERHAKRIGKIKAIEDKYLKSC